MRMIREHLPASYLNAAKQQKVSTILKLNVQTQGGNNHRSAVAVVTGVVDVLYPDRWVKSAPKMQCVIGLLNGFSPIPEAAIAQQKTITAERQILLVISRNPIGSEGYSRAVEFSAPALPGRSCPQLHRAVHFG